jgi:hypothetical protein
MNGVQVFMNLFIREAIFCVNSEFDVSVRVIRQIYTR